MKTVMAFVLSTVVVCLAFSVQKASTPTASDQPAKLFKKLDHNGDGKLSREELMQMPGLVRLLSVADADKDGALTAEEIIAYMNQLATKRLQSATPPPDAPYIQTEHRITVDGRERTFIVQEPKVKKGKLPVVFVFHGGGGRGINMAAVGFRDMVAEEQFLAVYPDGWKGNWNDGRNAPSIASHREGVDDVKFVRTIVEYLASRYDIDRSRIFATGGSNGGIFCHYLAAKASDLFAGIAPIIGGMAEPVAKTFKPSHPISLLVIQSDADPLVPINGGPIAGSARRGRIISTDEMLRKYLAHNGIPAEPKIEQLPDIDPHDGTVTVVYRWPLGRDGVRVEYYLVKGGGHTVPGIGGGGALREALVGKTSRDFNALKIIWNFFKSCPPRQQSDSPSNEPAPNGVKQ